MGAPPQLSIIIASYNSKETIGACLDALCRQKTQQPFEVIVVDSSADGTAELVARDFPSVRLLRFARRKYPGAARNAALDIAAAPVVAFTDADCVPREDYVQALCDAHQDAAPAIGGAIANHEPAGAVAWAAYFCEFSEWMPGTPRRIAANLATANASYKKWVFQRYGRFLEGTYGSDTDFNWRLVRNGHKLLWSPAIAVSHQSIPRLCTYLRHEFGHGKDCCRMRIRSERFSSLRRWACAVACPLIPWKIFLMIGARNLRNRTCLPRFLAVSPLVALGLAFWCCGEFVAFLRPEYAPDRRQA